MADWKQLLADICNADEALATAPDVYLGTCQDVFNDAIERAKRALTEDGGD